MREIKFRAWSTKDSKWAHIDLDDWRHSVGPMASLSNETIPQTLELLTDDYFVWQQYTGLKDRHGVEIYEGDIVDFWSRRDYDIEAPFYINRRKRRVVQWVSNSYKNTINIRTPKDENLAYHEVIGNIYENKELLND